jgi:hypothetical protein
LSHQNQNQNFKKMATMYAVGNNHPQTFTAGTFESHQNQRILLGIRAELAKIWNKLEEKENEKQPTNANSSPAAASGSSPPQRRYDQQVIVHCDAFLALPLITPGTTFDEQIEQAIEIFTQVGTECDYAKNFCIPFKTLLFQLKTQICQEARNRCAELLNKLRNIVVAHPSFFVASKSKLHQSTFTEMISIETQMKDLFQKFIGSVPVNETWKKFSSRLIQSSTR